MLVLSNLHLYCFTTWDHLRLLLVYRASISHPDANLALVAPTLGLETIHSRPGIASVAGSR